MSDLFYALEQGQAYTLLVSPDARVWIMSAAQCVRNLLHALGCDSQLAPENRVATLPAIWASMKELVHEVARATGNSPALVQYAPDPGLEAAFGAQPALKTPAAEALGMKHDGDLRTLVASALETIRSGR
jgi:nucleoside-diphosphate-sugar epimerase